MWGHHPVILPRPRFACTPFFAFTMGRIAPCAGCCCNVAFCCCCAVIVMGWGQSGNAKIIANATVCRSKPVLGASGERHCGMIRTHQHQRPTTRSRRWNSTSGPRVRDAGQTRPNSAPQPCAQAADQQWLKIGLQSGRGGNSFGILLLGGNCTQYPQIRITHPGGAQPQGERVSCGAQFGKPAQLWNIAVCASLT